MNIINPQLATPARAAVVAEQERCWAVVSAAIAAEHALLRESVARAIALSRSPTAPLGGEVAPCH